MHWHAPNVDQSMPLWNRCGPIIDDAIRLIVFVVPEMVSKRSKRKKVCKWLEWKHLNWIEWRNFDIFTIDFYSFLFSFGKGLWAHQKNHHPDRFPYRCKVCPRAFKHSGELKEHIGAIHARGNDVECDFCSKVLMSVYEKENHIKQQHRDRRYYCGLCNDYKTISQVNLRRHTKEKHPGQSQPLSF